MKLVVVAVLAGLCAFASAVELVLSRHQARQLFVELQSLRESRLELDREWGRLLLEQATWATQARVEELARGSLNMLSPAPGHVIELR
ncbi:MAG: cell division protein FtsL [Gammaproteobacteria bacterium]